MFKYKLTKNQFLFLKEMKIDFLGFNVSIKSYKYISIFISERNEN